MSSLPALYPPYEYLKHILACEVLGLIEIGSQARGEALPTSDHDLRLIVRSPEPYLLLKEHTWTQTPNVQCTYLTWDQLNPFEEQGATFGLTNLTFVQSALDSGVYPINDHTALYQGQLLLDETGIIEKFKRQHSEVRFANIVNDYLHQTEWRVTHRLHSEIESALKGEGLDSHKFAVPALHTACRILRDLANIETYHTTTAYLNNPAALNYYYQSRWPAYYSTFQNLFAYKTNQQLRRSIFQQIQSGLPAGLQLLQAVQTEIEQLWAKFKTRLKI